MAATRRARKVPRRRRHAARLPWLAAGLGSLLARQARGQSSLDSRFLFYKESSGRTQVINPVLLLQDDFGEKYGLLGLTLGYDAISGASPTGAYPTSDVTTSASGRLVAAGNFPQAQYTDSRKSATFSYSRKFGAHLPTIDLSYARENDYTARGVEISDAWTVLHGLGTLHAGFSLSRDIVAPVTNHLQLPKSTNGFSLGFTRILGERDLIDVSASVMQLSGYLDDPYKVVPIGPVGTATTVAEHRPDTRSRRALVVKYGHHYPWEGAVKVTYRYYNDSWSVQAHTLEVEYDQHLFSDWIVAPQFRFYTQTGASFYASRLDASRTFLSADYRLSPLSNVLGGLIVTRKINDAISANVGATIQSQTGRDRVTPVLTTPIGAGRIGSVSAADMNVVTFSVGFTRLF